ncbi:MAG: TadE/TadG family type IV pilus assembly protein [Bacillota bacterium]
MAANSARSGGEKGQAVLEFALIIPILLLFLFGVIEFGRVFSAQLTVNAAAREGARYGIIGDRTASQIEARVKKFAANLSASQLVVDVSKGTEFVHVSVRYPVAIILPPVRGILPDTVEVRGAATMRRE